MKNINVKKLVTTILPYVFLFYFSDKAGQSFRLSLGHDLSQKVLNLKNGFGLAFTSPLPSFHPQDLLVGVIGAALVAIAIQVKRSNAKKYRKGIEYGSARFGTPADIAPFIDPNPENNIILTQTERLTMDSRPKNPAHARNKNVLVIGGSGSGKTRFFVKPNLMQCTSKDFPVSFCVTDPKGTVLLEVGQLLRRCGYEIKILNTVNFAKSMKYNPFQYIKSEKDILKLVNTLILNTRGEGEKSNEDFWVKAEKLYYTALIGYIFYEGRPDERNFISLLDMINASDASEDDEQHKNPVDLMFEKLAKKNPEHFAVLQYAKYKMAAGKTAKSILISCGARLSLFDIKELRDLMEYDELGLDEIGDRKAAFFIVTSDTDSTFDFLSSMVIMQMFNTLCTKADDEYGGRLPFHVRCLLDEFSQVKIPDMQRLISVIRSREISAALIVQAQSQIKANYKDHADTLAGSCDVTLFLGGREKGTLKDMAELLGRETIDNINTSENRGQSASYGMNYQKLGKELMSQDEIAVMDGGKCLCLVRGVRPFLSYKYDITKHPRYKYLSDYDKRNTFDVEKYLARLRRPHPPVAPDEPFDCFDYGDDDNDAIGEIDAEPVSTNETA